MQQAAARDPAKLSSPSAERNKEPIWNVLQSKVLPNVMMSIAVQQQQQQQQQQHNKSDHDSSDNNHDHDRKPSVRFLEVAAGAGVHVHHFVGKLLQQQQQGDDNSNYTNYYFEYQSTDPDPSSVASQQAYLNELLPLLSSNSSYNKNVLVRAPLQLTLDQTGIQQAETARQIDPSSLLLSSENENQDTDDENNNNWWDVMININMIHISPWSACEGLMQLAGTHLRPGTGMLYLYGPYRVAGTCVESNLSFEKWLHSLDSAYGVRDLEAVVDLAKQHGLDLVETIEMPANNLSVLFRRRPRKQE